MRNFLSKNIILLAESLDKPLYLVGGAVRNFLIDRSISKDIDLSGSIASEQFVLALDKCGLKVSATYPRTGTVMFKDGIYNCEYTCFRREEYSGGGHTPTSVEWTDDILEDALRRDFKCNAVYYDIKGQKFIDPLGGINDIENKTLDTVKEPDKVFCADGLRLMRLARFCGELDFNPTDKVLVGAKKFRDNILDISKERIFCELKLILTADKKYPFSNKFGHYKALKILDEIRVLDNIIPELTLGRGMEQRKDYHKFDVLEHVLKSVMYGDQKVRLALLLHDVGKPYCFNRDGNFHKHHVEGVAIAEKVLKRLGADNKTISQVKFLVKEHMVDMDCAMKEVKVKRFIQKNHQYLEQLFMVKQADFTASLESAEIAPTIVKWTKIYQKMKEDGTPFSLNQLNIRATDLIEIGYKNQKIKEELNALFDFALQNPNKNNYQILMDKARCDFLNDKRSF